MESWVLLVACANDDTVLRLAGADSVTLVWATRLGLEIFMVREAMSGGCLLDISVSQSPSGFGSRFRGRILVGPRGPFEPCAQTLPEYMYVYRAGDQVHELTF